MPRLYSRERYGGSILAAKACVSFVEAVEKRIGKLRKLADQHLRLGKELDRAVQQAERTDNWEEVGKVLANVEKVAKNAEPLLWSVPRIQRYTGGTESFAKALDKIHGASTTFVNARAAGASGSQAASLAGAREVLSWLPVFGAVYVAALDWAIQFVPEWKSFTRDRMKAAWSGHHVSWMRP